MAGVDKGRVGKLFADLERYFEDLKELDIKDVRQLDDKRNFYSLSMLLFSVLNVVIDLGEEIIKAKGLGVPTTYREIFLIIGNSDLMDKSLCERVAELMYFRNLLAHEYYSFDKNKIFSLYQRLYLIEQFIKEAKKIFLDDESKGKYGQDLLMKAFEELSNRLEREDDTIREYLKTRAIEMFADFIESLREVEK